MSDHVVDRISAFLDGELEESERTGVARHLEGCAECSARLEELAAVDRFAASVPVDAPEGYFEGFASRVRDRIRKPARRRIVAPAWLLTAAAAVLLAVTVPVLLRRQLEGAHRDVPAAGALAPAPTTRSAPATLPPEAQDSLRATGYAGEQGRLERKRDDAPSGRAGGREPAKAQAARPELKKDEHAGVLTPAPLARQAPPPAAPAPASEPLPQSRANAEREADENARTPGLEERKQQAEGRAWEPTQSAGGFASRPESAEESTALETAEAPKRALQNSAPSAAFRALLARQAATIAEARGLREAWRAFAQGAAEGEADEARVRVIENGREAYRLSGERVDLDQLRRDASAYLKRTDAHQAERVRALLRDLPR